MQQKVRAGGLEIWQPQNSSRITDRSNSASCANDYNRDEISRI